ncbi:unnamed protein product, partial [Ectocarpus sp. 13 AM-2016]
VTSRAEWNDPKGGGPCPAQTAFLYLCTAPSDSIVGTTPTRFRPFSYGIGDTVHSLEGSARGLLKIVNKTNHVFEHRRTGAGRRSTPGEPTNTKQSGASAPVSCFEQECGKRQGCDDVMHQWRVRSEDDPVSIFGFGFSSRTRCPQVFPRCPHPAKAVPVLRCRRIAVFHFQGPTENICKQPKYKHI